MRAIFRVKHHFVVGAEARASLCFWGWKRSNAHFSTNGSRRRLEVPRRENNHDKKRAATSRQHTGGPKRKRIPKKCLHLHLFWDEETCTRLPLAVPCKELRPLYAREYRLWQKQNAKTIAFFRFSRERGDAIEGGGILFSGVSFPPFNVGLQYGETTSLLVITGIKSSSPQAIPLKNWLSDTRSYILGVGSAHRTKSKPNMDKNWLLCCLVGDNPKKNPNEWQKRAPHRQ